MAQLALAEAPHRNQQLFSDHYLNVILPRRAEWQMLTGQARATMERVGTILADYTPSANEAQTERELVQPVLQALGHTFEVQVPLRTPDGTKKPDYLFYGAEAPLVANKGQVMTDRLAAASGVFAVGDAKYWERPLDVTLKGAGDPFSNRNPSYQIAFYMQHAGVPWGILTNGRLWRLYHRDTAHKLERFYEVDLPALLALHDADAFLYFYAFFHRSAFDDHPLGVARLLAASSDFARGVGDTLKVQVYEALRHLAQGFLDYAPNKLRADEPTLTLIYDNSLIVLYRLLFILYAESRELLPVRENKSYRGDYSLHAIKNEVAQALTTGRTLLSSSALLWPRLSELFRLIDQGSPPLNVSTFNGGLFAPERHTFLTEYAVGDAHLQQAIDQLARVDGQFVDYRDLEIRHLGTIYEGLLEYHLEVEGERTIALVNEKGERKASGSYYTPDYIVQYMVEEALGPVLRAAVAGAANDAARVKAVLSVNVLDPSMGSGHFLVEATERIARFLVDLGLDPDTADVVPPPPKSGEGAARSAGGGGRLESDLAHWKRRVVQSCIYGVDLNPLAVELAKLSLWLTTVARERPLSFLDHHLRTGNSLVGAWIKELPEYRPDDPKKRRAARQQIQAQVEAGQLALVGDDEFRRQISIAVDYMWLIEKSAGRTVEEVKEQERIYARMRRELIERYGRLADLIAAEAFGVITVEATEWNRLTALARGKEQAASSTLADLLRKADALALIYHFFHWYLEFPEVFFNQEGKPKADGGFDVVLGNPPYVRQEQLSPLKPYFARAFEKVYSGTADLFVYFFSRGVELLREGGTLSYISSNSWLRANYAEALRAYLRTHTTIETLVDLGDNRVFADAPDVYPAIPVVRRLPPPDDHIARTASFTRGEGLSNFAERVAEKLQPVTIHDQPDSGWQLDDAERRVFNKLMAGGVPLNEVVNGQIYRGIVTGFNEAFFIDQSTRDKLVNAHSSSAEIIKLCLRGSDLRSWYQEQSGKWLIFTRRGIDIDAYPAVKEYLQRYQTQLEPRPKDWDGKSEWPGRKPGPYKWYEIQDSIDYYPAFEKPKIVWPDIAKTPRFSWDESGFYVNDKGFIVIPSHPYLLGILQSRVSWFCISQLCVPLGERAGLIRYQQKSQFISRLPIPDADTEQRDTIGALAMELTALARQRYALHQRARHRLLTDLAQPGDTLNQKLTTWWDLDFATLRRELTKALRTDIPLRERDDWEAWLDDARAKHQRLTAQIIALETRLNQHVYTLFDLSPAEIAMVEEGTKYEYGVV